MAENKSLTIPAHNNIYHGSASRDLRIDFSIPDLGVTVDTGLLIFEPGFGANIESNVYKKMRDIFADKYNLVTLQCSFLGDEFMQGVERFCLKNDISDVERHLNAEVLETFRGNSESLFSLLSTKSITLPVIAKLKETKDYFNDMGLCKPLIS